MLYSGRGYGPHETSHILEEVLAATLLISPILRTSLGPRIHIPPTRQQILSTITSKLQPEAGGAKI